MKRTVLALAALVLALPILAGAAELLAVPTAPTKSPVEIQSITATEVKANRVVLTVRWKYVEQDNLPRPKELSIIAILIGLHGEKVTSKLNVPVPPSGPIPLAAAVTLEPDSFFPYGAGITATVSVLPKIAGISDGTSNIQDGSSNTLTAKKTVTLNLAP